MFILVTEQWREVVDCSRSVPRPSLGTLQFLDKITNHGIAP